MGFLNAHRLIWMIQNGAKLVVIGGILNVLATVSVVSFGATYGSGFGLGAMIGGLFLSGFGLGMMFVAHRLIRSAFREVPPME